MKIEIEGVENSSHGVDWKVTYGDKYADRLGYDEMLALVTVIAMPEKRPCLQWLKTEAEHIEWNKRYKT